MAEINSYVNDIRQVLTQNLPLDKLSGCNILITGATGLIGSCVTDMLMMASVKGLKVYAFGRNRERAEKRFKEYWNTPRFSFIEHDITKPLQTDVNFDYIIHAASNASPNFFSNNPVEVMMANILGVSNLMEYGIAHNMKRLLFVSSGEIYGEGDGSVFTEQSSGYVDCATLRACYPSSKRAAETLCIAYAHEHQKEVVIARPCHTYGPGFTESDNRAYAQFLRNAIKGEDIVLKSKGEQFRSWIYVVDCASALLYILLKGENCQAYNVADEKSNVTIRQLAEAIAQQAGCHVVFELNSTTENTPITKATFSTNKLECLGWKPFTSLREGIQHTISMLSL